MVYFGPKGPRLVGPIAIAVLGNVVLYSACGALHQRWAPLPQVDRWRRLATTVGVSVFIALAVSSIMAFNR